MRGLSLCCLLACNAMADVVIDRTRILYPAASREVSVQLTNPADTPRLVQVWIDNGDARLPPEYSDVPFSVTPPMLRLEPGKGKALRVAFHPAQGQGMATDQESVYWLNVLSIRPTPSGNHLNLAFRTRIKLFLRPEALPTSRTPLQWRVLSHSPLQLEARNESVYHVTLSQVAWRVAGVDYRNDDPPMIPPKTTLVLPLQGQSAHPAGTGVLRFIVLDDHAIARHYEQPL
ncbi:molecular chaperone [Pseudomonas kairouanensis]|uniref:Molecular chaperone n=1 Tax=Pseudomonas kairouanensis TaxID=2293832 RepID=A0A4Z0AN18_9PSED|nr:molecular chaperone [Pseudomonas kairouanensis]TFY87549.1 molecular chaperone [Pseudomonas kairouanensis]